MTGFGWLGALIVGVILLVVAYMAPLPPPVRTILLIVGWILVIVGVILLLVSLLGAGGLAVSSLAALA